MSAPATVPGLDQAPTSHPRLLAWVHEVAELTTPDRVVWCDGSDAEWQRLTDGLVEAGTLVRLNDLGGLQDLAPPRRDRRGKN